MIMPVQQDYLRQPLKCWQIDNIFHKYARLADLPDGIRPHLARATFIVITDMTMPNMAGDRLAKELMKIRTDIPIILCTGYSNGISKHKAKEIDISAFVMKPLVRRDLSVIVRKVLDEA